jgi:hypothetical protein
MRRKRKSPTPSQRRDAGRVTVYRVASRLPAPTDTPSKFVGLLAKGYWRGEGPPRELLAQADAILSPSQQRWCLYFV